MIERECKNYYKTNSEKAKGRYEIVKNVCLDLDILTLRREVPFLDSRRLAGGG